MTSNAAITGNFSASESLEMITANAKISGNIELSNDGEQGVTDLIIKTRHASVVYFVLYIKTQTKFGIMILVLLN